MKLISFDQNQGVRCHCNLELPDIVEKYMKNGRPERIILAIVSQIKSLRHSRNMSHDDLAKKSGVTRPAISHIENGKRKPSLLMSLKLAQALGKNLSDMLHEAENAEDKK